MPSSSSHQLPRRSRCRGDGSRLETRVSSKVEPDDVDRVGGDGRVVIEGEGEIETSGDGDDDVGDVLDGLGDRGKAEEEVNEEGGELCSSSKEERRRTSQFGS